MTMTELQSASRRCYRWMAGRRCAAPKTSFPQNVSFVLLILVFRTALVAQPGPVLSKLAVDIFGNLYRTSDLMLRTPGPVPNANIFHYSASSGWSWFTPAWGPATGSVDVSATGDAMAITSEETTYECSDPRCQGTIPVVTAGTLIVAAGRRIGTFKGYGQISHNGRYALVSASPDILIDLTTGTSTMFNGAVASIKQGITDAGCVLLQGSKQISLHCPTADTQFSTARQFDIARINATGTRIVYSYLSSRQPTVLVLRIIDVATSQDVLLAQESSAPGLAWNMDRQASSGFRMTVVRSFTPRVALRVRRRR